jgi:hypothetical protein
MELCEQTWSKLKSHVLTPPTASSYTVIDDEGLPSSSSSTSLSASSTSSGSSSPRPPSSSSSSSRNTLAIALGVSLGLLGGLSLIFLAYIFGWRHAQAARARLDGTGVRVSDQTTEYEGGLHGSVNPLHFMHGAAAAPFLESTGPFHRSMDPPLTRVSDLGVTDVPTDTDLYSTHNVAKSPPAYDE